MQILGLDPGSRSFGIGIIRQEGQKLTFVHAEEIKLPDKEFITRMGLLWDHLQRLLSSFILNQAAMEEGFMGKNVRSMNLLAVVRGVAMAALINRGIPLRTYAPRLVKQALTGYGNASKAQMGRMVRLLLHTPQPIGEDAADALALACCLAMER